jgi:type IVB pilus formation R64 PilN family outer membrane protein
MALIKNREVGTTPRVAILLLAVLGALNGCTTFSQVSENVRDVDRDFAASTQKIQNQRAQPGKQDRDTVRYMDTQWVTLKPIVASQERQAPAVLRCKINKLITAEPVSVLEFAQIVTKHCGVPVRVTPDALGAINNPLAADGGTAAVGIPGAGSQQQGVGGVGMPLNANTATTNINNLVDINYSGDLAGLLDTVTARFGLNWKFEDGRIRVYNLDTQTFYLATLASETDMRAEMQSGTTMVNGAAGGGSSSSGGASGGSSSGGVGGSSGTNQTTTVTLKTSIWGDVKTTLESMRSPKGKIAVAPATGAVTVTDNADVLHRVRTYIERENENLTKQVLFSVKVVSVTIKDSNSLGISWTAVYQSLGQKYGFSLGSSFAAPASAVTGTVSILNGSGSKWSGTDAIVSALAEQGHVSVLREPSASTLNLQPVALQVASQTGYIASTSTTTTANVGSSTALQTGTVTTGFNMSLLPYVMPDNRMLLQFSVNLSSLRSLRKVTQGSAVAELPEIDLPVNSTQKVRLAPGDTLMLSGFDQTDKSATRSGSFSPENFLFGGGVGADKTRSTLVVLITPVILD